ncbi:inorganic diphosphatase [Candidatus Pacearchaeota archaeon]|nr:inorganic diphosphatase [Candidatus Pacearchaeota archaeon]
MPLKNVHYKHPWHDIPIGDKSPIIVNAIIEIPKDGHLKYELDKDSGMLKLDRFLYSAVHYPGDYGFVPQTLWDDEDPLDIVILTHRSVLPMTLVSVRIIGILRMIDGEEKDDKLIGVYDCDPRYVEFQSIKDVPRHMIAELKHFFETYKELQGKKCKILQILDKQVAYKDIEIARKLYDLKFRPDILANIQKN